MSIFKNALKEAYEHTGNLKNRTGLTESERLMYACQNWNIKQIIQFVAAIEKLAKNINTKQK